MAWALKPVRSATVWMGNVYKRSQLDNMQTLCSTLIRNLPLRLLYKLDIPAMPVEVGSRTWHVNIFCVAKQASLLPVKFFSPNIQTPGRIARGLCGVAALAGAWLYREHTTGGITLALSGGLMLFEAFRGWCLARACGLKTPM